MIKKMNYVFPIISHSGIFILLLILITLFVFLFQFNQMIGVMLLSMIAFYYLLIDRSRKRRRKA
jgi:hypothetical protein